MGMSKGRLERELGSEEVLKFKFLFERERREILYSQNLMHESFNLQVEDLPDSVDLASSELETSMRMRLRNRESLYLKKINEALQRIAEGSFGKCVECEEDIGLSRLEARPTASCCLQCKEEQEQREHHHIDGHQFKSLGASVGLFG